jgi:hypothetical protein
LNRLVPPRKKAEVVVELKAIVASAEESKRDPVAAGPGQPI